MVETKRQYGKMEGVLGYHFIQSFAPGEVTAEQAHEIGVEFARRCFGDRFQVVIGTHLDHAHYHNHIVVNSVSFADGRKYHSSPKSYFENIRGKSDELCREYGLSVIEPKGGGKHYAEWKAEKEGAPTWRGLIREDVDKAVRQSASYPQFLRTLAEMGYEVKTGVKHMAVRPPGKERFVRMRSLGEDYTEDALKRRVQARTQPERSRPPKPKPQARKRVRFKGVFTVRILSGRISHPRPIRGFRALYYHYLHILRAARSPHRQGAAFLYREDLRYTRQLSEQARLLWANEIDTAEELADYRAGLTAEIKELTEARDKLTAGHMKSAPEQLVVLEDTAVRLRKLRKEVRLCESILTRAEEIHRKMQLVRQQEERINTRTQGQNRVEVDAALR